MNRTVHLKFQLEISLFKYSTLIRAACFFAHLSWSPFFSSVFNNNRVCMRVLDEDLTN